MANCTFTCPGISIGLLGGTGAFRRILGFASIEVPHDVSRHHATRGLAASSTAAELAKRNLSPCQIYLRIPPTIQLQAATGTNPSDRHW